MKTLIRTLALFSFMLFGCIGLMGQKNILVQDIQPLLAYSSDFRSGIILSADISLNSYHFYVEDKIQLRDWMISKDEWMATGGMGLASDIRIESEKGLQLEEWMLGSFKAKDQWLTILVEEEKEYPVQLQDWMLCCEEWQAVGL